MEDQSLPNCRNCQYPLPVDASFCPSCGQRNTDGRITFGELASQFLDNLLNFDGRIFQTMKALLVPGKLTKDFFEGKHIRYYHPVRLFILSGALFIGLLSYIFSKTDITAIDKIWEKQEKAYELKKLSERMDTLSLQIAGEYPVPGVQEAFDTLNARLLRESDLDISDSVEMNNAISYNFKDNRKEKIALEDLVNLPEDSLVNKYGKGGFWERQIFLQNIRIQKSVKSFFFYMIGNILWMVFIMMPMLAVALKLLYFRKPILYIEHLIFSFHTHTFGFILYGILLLLSEWTGAELGKWGFFGLGFYLLFAMKKFYDQGWGMTLFKFIVINILYLIIFITAATLMLLVSALLF